MGTAGKPCGTARAGFRRRSDAGTQAAVGRSFQPTLRQREAVSSMRSSSSARARVGLSVPRLVAGAEALVGDVERGEDGDLQGVAAAVSCVASRIFASTYAASSAT